MVPIIEFTLTQNYHNILY